MDGAKRKSTLNYISPQILNQIGEISLKVS